MVFSSTVFLFLFLPALLICYYLPIKNPRNRRRWRNGILLLFSVVFYAWGEPLFVFVMLGSVLLNWALALLLSRTEGKPRKVWLTVCIILDVALLEVFKYASFLSENLAVLCGNDSLIISIALPIGISFFTFQMMSYVFDVYYKNAQPQKNPLYVALYITLFPQLIAGPIVRYVEVESDILGREEHSADLTEGMKRFVYGLGKKVLIANYVAQIADNVFDYIAAPSCLLAWLGAIAYTLQIYFDFSGYSDMAIGLGRMFGFRFAENFRYPYVACNVTDFWRRWHISLSSWFRDYVYIPLGGNRVNKSRWVLNLLVVWLLTGIWHGANWTFLLWGFLYFLVLLIEKNTGLDKKKNVFTHLYTLVIVILAWVIFRSADVTSAITYIGRMFGWTSADGITAGAGLWSTLKDTWLILLIAVVGTTPLVSRLFHRLNETKFSWLESAWLILIFAASVCQIVSSSYNPFIYFNF